MTTEPETKTTARLLVRGFNNHIRDHGPDSDCAGEVTERGDGHGFVVERGGVQYSVTVEQMPAASRGEDEPAAKRPVLTSRYVFNVLYDAGFTPWGNGEPGFTTGWYMDAITVDHVGADLPVHGPLEGSRAIVADYAQTLYAAGFDTHITVNTVYVRKRAAAKTATAGEE